MRPCPRSTTRSQKRTTLQRSCDTSTMVTFSARSLSMWAKHLLWNSASPPPQRSRDAALNGHFAPSGRAYARHDAQERALPRAVGTNDAHAFALANAQRDVIERPEGPALASVEDGRQGGER